MMRDSRGRFVNDREHAATLLLEAALEEARTRIFEADTFTIEKVSGGVIGRYMVYDRPATVRMLAEATRSADLLLKGAER